MRIRHLVSADNVDAAGFVVDPLLARHGIIVAGSIDQLAAPIDPLTHLNLDFPDHDLGECLVAEQLAVGAALLWEAERFRVAYAQPSAYARRGSVDIDRQRIAWQAQWRTEN